MDDFGTKTPVSAGQVLLNSEVLSKVEVIKDLKTVMLNHENYFTLRTQFMVNFWGNNLLEYVIGKASLDDAILVKHDQLILGWLLFSISSTMLA